MEVLTFYRHSLDEIQPLIGKKFWLPINFLWKAYVLVRNSKHVVTESTIKFGKFLKIYKVFGLFRFFFINYDFMFGIRNIDAYFSWEKTLECKSVFRFFFRRFIGEDICLVIYLLMKTTIFIAIENNQSRLARLIKHVIISSEFHREKPIASFFNIYLQIKT